MKRVFRGRWSAALVACAAALAAILPARGATPPAPATPQHLYIMFLPGLCGWTGSDSYCHGTVNAQGRVRATFRVLMSALTRAHVNYTPLYYSYSPSSNTGYSVNDTHGTVARDVTALERQLRIVSRHDRSAHFVLIGHSLGGVVAADWAATTGRWYGLDPSKGLLRSTGSIVTFDSPVLGIHSRFTTNIIARYFGGAVWNALQPDSETIRNITFFPDWWWRGTGRIHTVANSLDEIVPPPESLLGTKKLVFDGSCPRDLFLLRTCHGAVLADTTLNTYVACHWVTTNDQCNPRPIPTRTPVRPTATATATVTPVPTLTQVPTATPTVVPSPSPAPSPTAG